MKSVLLVLQRLMLATPVLLLTLSAVAQTPAPTAPAAATAPAAPASAINSGDTAWMLTSMALVLMMTIPGLALFLWRHGSQDERASDGHAELCGDLSRHRVVDGDRL